MGQYYNPCILSDDKTKVTHSACAHNFDNGLKLMEHSWIGNGFVRHVENFLTDNPRRLAWAGDYAETNYYEQGDSADLITNVDVMDEKDIIINHSRKEFVVKSKSKGDDWKIHPLPLLTSMGNGQGGGDFRGSDPDGVVGLWATDIIELSDNAPEGYSEMEFNLIED